MMQAITQTAIVAGKAVIMAIKEAENLLNATRSVQVMVRIGHPTLNSQHLIGRQQTNIRN